MSIKNWEGGKHEGNATQRVASVVEAAGEITYADLLADSSDLLGALESWDVYMCQRALNSVLLKLENYGLITFNVNSKEIVWVG